MASFVDNFTGKVWDWTKPFQRTGQFPLDRSAIFASYEDAVKYAKGDAADPDSRALYATSYVGQIISVYEGGKVKVYKIEEDRSLAGIGGAALVAENYEAAVALATEETLGQTVYVSTETESGKAGLYVITGAGLVERLGTTTATGDPTKDINALKAEITTLKGGAEVEGSIDQKVADAIEAIDFEPYATTENVNKALENYVAKEGYVAYSQEEKNKLAGIAEGAQVNVIEKVIFNGQEIEVDAQTKSVTLTTPLDVVRGLADGEKFLSLDEATGKLGATVGLTYYTDTTGETPVYEIRLTGKGGEVISTIDAKSFVKDGMLNTVELVSNPADQPAGTYLVFTWNTEAGVSEPMFVPVTDLIDVYTAGDGISIDNKVIKAQVKSGDSYIEVTTEGIASKGIDNAILVAKNAVVGAETDTEAAVTVYGAKKYAANLVSAHESAMTTALSNKADKDAFDTFVSETNETLSGIKVTDVDVTEVSGIKLTKSEAGVIGVSVSTDTLVNNLVGATGVVGPVSGTTIKLGEDIVIEEKVEGSETPQQVVIGQAGSSVQSAIKTLAGKIETAIAGGITAIDGGEYITVGGSSTSKTLALNVAKIGTYLVDNSSALKVNADGKITLEWESVE